MKVGFRITLDGRVYVGRDRIFESDQEFEEFVRDLSIDRAKAIGSIVIDPGAEGESQGIDSITLNVGQEAADRIGVFVVHYKADSGA